MIIYVYECKLCGTKVERPQDIKKKMTNPLCQVCGKKMKLVIQPTAVHFKGGGWTK